MNRIRAYLEEPEERVPGGDYFVVSGACGTFYVTAETARAVERALDRVWGRRWLVFRDLAGSRIRVLRRQVQGVYESTVVQRRKDRAFYRALQEESETDSRPWEE